MISFKVDQTQNKAQIFWLLFGLTVLTMVGMQITGSALVNETAPGGIVSLELVGTLVGSQSMVQSWQGSAMTWAGINLGLDFLFLTLYAVTIALACQLISDKYKNQLLQKIGTWLAVGIVIAALLDIIENIALIKLLLGSQNEILPVLAKWVAIPKFLLAIIALLYVLGGLVSVVRYGKNLAVSEGE